MARLDAFIELLFQEPGSELWFETGGAAVIRGPGGERPVIKRALTTAQIVGALSEIAPEGMSNGFPPEPGTVFNYRAPRGTVTVRIEERGPDLLKAVVAPDARKPGKPQAQAEAPAAPSTKGPQPAGVPRQDPPPATPPQHVAIASGPLPEEAGAAMAALLRMMLEKGASDLHLSSKMTPCLRVDGDVVPVQGFGELAPERLRDLLWSITPETYRKEWQERKDTDFAHETKDARFRVNIFSDRNGIGAVLRQIPTKIRTAEEMNLSQHVLGLCGLSKGLVLVTGPTGSGKSTTLAAMVDYVNRNRDDHIITIEDPIEFVHQNKKCLVNQREIGTHTNSFKSALRAALREDPDIVLVGEMRDLETISIALETAETGHLVFGTLHTNTAPSTIDRIIDQFPSDRQSQVRTMLSESLKGVVTQVLCKKIGGGRVPALEVLLCNNAVANLIREGKTFQVPSIMQTGRAQGMVTMNDALLDLVRSKQVLPKDAIAKAVHKAELKAALEKAGFKIEDPEAVAAVA
jgi:twitching motility protein PilT